MSKISGMLATCFLWTNTIGLGQATTVKTVVSVKPETQQKQYSWKYKITWTGDLIEGRSVGISFKIPEDHTNVRISGPGKWKKHKKPGLFCQWVSKVSKEEENKKRKTAKMTLSGFATNLKSDGVVKWRGEYAMSPSGKGKINGPELVFDTSRFRLVLAAGTEVRMKDIVDFKEQEVSSGKASMTSRPYLFTVNDGRLRATGLFGGAFRLGRRTERPLEAILSLQFTTNTDRVVDGFFFGLSYGVQKYLSIGGGYSLRLGKELSYGFRREAARYVQSEDELTDRFPVSRDMNGLMNVKYYDGLPLTDGMGERWFPGNPIVDSFNHSLFIGVFLPIDIGKLIAGAE